MGKIGNWGKTITFEVSSSKTLTFNNFKRTVSGRWNTHNIVNGKPKSEFAGPDLSGVTLEAVLAAERGVRPRATLENLEKACEGGTVDYLYIGGGKVGTGKMKLESISETWDEIWNSGELVKAKVSLTFSEY